VPLNPQTAPPLLAKDSPPLTVPKHDDIMTPDFGVVYLTDVVFRPVND